MPLYQQYAVFECESCSRHVGVPITAKSSDGLEMGRLHAKQAVADAECKECGGTGFAFYDLTDDEPPTVVTLERDHATLQDIIDAIRNRFM